MTQVEAYDWLLAEGVSDPATVIVNDQDGLVRSFGHITSVGERFSQRFIVGRWETVSEELPNGHICRVGRVGIHVLGEGSTWDAACEAAKARLGDERLPRVRG